MTKLTDHGDLELSPTLIAFDQPSKASGCNTKQFFYSKAASRDGPTSVWPSTPGTTYLRLVARSVDSYRF